LILERAGALFLSAGVPDGNSCAHGHLGIKAGVTALVFCYITNNDRITPQNADESFGRFWVQFFGIDDVMDFQSAVDFMQLDVLDIFIVERFLFECSPGTDAISKPQPQKN
jgi:hypothetical protein